MARDRTSWFRNPWNLAAWGLIGLWGLTGLFVLLARPADPAYPAAIAAPAPAGASPTDEVYGRLHELAAMAAAAARRFVRWFDVVLTAFVWGAAVLLVLIGRLRAQPRPDADAPDAPGARRESP